MAPWNASLPDDLDDPLTCSQAEIAWQINDLSNRINTIKAQVGGKLSDGAHDRLGGISKGKGAEQTSVDAEKLAAEAEKGSVKLKMTTDAHGEQRMTREAHVLLLKLRASASSDKVLVELAREAPGEKRRTDMRLPGGKMLPDESIEDAANRFYRDVLKLQDCPMTLDFARVDSFQEEQESKTIQGVMTIYHKHIVAGYLNCERVDILARIGLKKEGAIWTTVDKSSGTVYYTWMQDDQAKGMKVRMSSEQPIDLPKQKHKRGAEKEVTLNHSLEEIQKKVENLYSRERRFTELEHGMRAVSQFLQAEHSSVETVIAQNLAKRNYVVQHADQLQEFVQALQEIEGLQCQINPPHLEQVPSLSLRVQRLESGAVVLAEASARMYQRVEHIAQDYHKTMTSVNAQMLTWNKLLDEKL